jgi:glycine/D-amino acid oxidase-like deaminating enzyme
VNHIAEPARQTPVVADVDVLVCGGGVAGVAAAICAARKGADVLLLERYGYLGGLATGGLVITVPPLDNGICTDVRLELEVARTYRVCENLGDDPSVDGLIAVDPEVLKYSLANMLLASGVRLLFHSYVVQALTVEGGGLSGVVVENKAGRSAILARMVVDATGDGDVSASAGAPCHLDADLPPITLMSNVIGVDSDRAMAQIGSWGKLRDLVAEGVRNGEIDFDLEVGSRGFAPGVLAADLCYPGEVNLWSGSLFGANALDPFELTQAEIVTREHTMRLIAFLRKRLAGFENARLEYTAPQIGVRGTRRVAGGCSPSLRQVVTGDVPGVVAKPYAGRRMRIPYGSLVPEKVDNLLVAGRCMSAEPDAMVQLRLIPVCFATGQAAGTAAALAVAEGVTPRELDVALLQSDLQAQGMDLAPDEPVGSRRPAAAQVADERPATPPR